MGGQSKHNPTAIAAKKGEIKPKEKGLTKAEEKRLIRFSARDIVYSSFPPIPRYK